MKNIFTILSLATFLTLVGCSKMIEIDSPVTELDARGVYQNDASAIAVMTSIYQKMSNGAYTQGQSGISMLLGLSADELLDYRMSMQLTAVYQNQVNANNEPFYATMYADISTLSSVIEGTEKSVALTPSIKKQVLGEAKFMRAYIYFQLTNIFGDVPLVLSKDFEINRLLPRSPVSEVYDTIISDLLVAQDWLSGDYLLSDLKSITTERIRPTKWAAKALLARVYLYKKRYAEAEALASEVISQNTTFQLVNLQDAFLKNSKEAIWQVQAILPQWNTLDARAFILSSAPNGTQPTSLSSQVISNFEAGDRRRVEWVGSFTNTSGTYYFPRKYRNVVENSPKTEYLTVLRLSEQFLIRAEARAQQSKIAEAVSDLNALRSRARDTPSLNVPTPLPDISANISSSNFMTALVKERMSELFTEWGHRWFDLKRWGTIDAVMTSVSVGKGTTWSPNKALFPLPQTELDRNPNIRQNPGY